jgi:hypothetical protein
VRNRAISVPLVTRCPRSTNTSATTPLMPNSTRTSFWGSMRPEALTVLRIVPRPIVITSSTSGSRATSYGAGLRNIQLATLRPSTRITMPLILTKRPISLLHCFSNQLRRTAHTPETV